MIARVFHPIIFGRGEHPERVETGGTEGPIEVDQEILARNSQCGHYQTHTGDGSMSSRSFCTRQATAAPTLLIAMHPCTAQTLVVTPSSLGFNMTADSGVLPAPQTIQVTSPNGNVPFTCGVGPSSAFVPPDPVFLSVTPTSGVTPATVTVHPEAAGMEEAARRIPSVALPSSM